MKIVVLSDNRSRRTDLATEHGLSVYVETCRHKVLLDTGASDLFMRNAAIQGIDITAVDYVFISHGHSDHIGGLPYFVKANSRAKIIMSADIIGSRYVSKRNGEHSITTDIDFDAIRDRLILISENTVIDDEISVIANIPYLLNIPAANCNLYVDRGGGVLEQDDFGHETALMINEMLFSGCAHHGILNILRAAPRKPFMVLGGFHLLDDYEDEDSLMYVSDYLRRDYPDTMFYTGHCTGNKCIAALKEVMNGRLDNFCLGYAFPDIRVCRLTAADDDITRTVCRLVRQLSATSELPTRDFLEEVIRTSAMYALYVDEKMVGMAVMCRNVMPTGVKYWIEDVTIDRDYRGRKLGKLMIRKMLADIPKGSKVMLTSRPAREAANMMYMTLGFEKRETNVYKKIV